MKSPRFHAQKADGLYQPIPFLFVTDRMCGEILAEREEIMAAMPAATRKRRGASPRAAGNPAQDQKAGDAGLR